MSKFDEFDLDIKSVEMHDLGDVEPMTITFNAECVINEQITTLHILSNKSIGG